MAEQMVKGMDWNKFGVLVENIDQSVKPKVISTKNDFDKLNDQWYVAQKIEKGRKFFINTQIDTTYSSISYYVEYIDELVIQTI